MNAYELSAAVKRHAYKLGFSACHISAIGEAAHAAFFEQWLAQGRAGEMRYLERNVAKRRSPALLAEPGQPPFASLIVLGADYHQFDLPPAIRDDPSRGLIASYAWGDDYHEIIRPLLYELDAFVRGLSGRTSLGKCLVDTGPVLERDWAQAAGLGFTGKNCCTIAPGEGSWLFLAVLLVPEALTPDGPLSPAPHVGVQHGHGGVPADPQGVRATRGGTAQGEQLRPDEPVQHVGVPADPHVGVQATREPHVGVRVTRGGTAQGEHLHPGEPVRMRAATCGQCTRCLAACPTGAFAGAYDLDPRRCISYWTIEASGPIPRELRPLFGNRIFGCDICQEVCPYNRRLGERSPLLAGLHAQAPRIAPPLLQGFDPDHPYWLDEQAFSEHFVCSPIKRARRRGMLRNVCVALGNWAAAAALPALRLALHDPDPLPRLHAAWALGQVARRHPHSAAAASAAAHLQAAASEADERVREEIAAAQA